jgi:hypothetical protein
VVPLIKMLSKKHAGRRVSTAIDAVVVNVPFTRTSSSFFANYTEYAVDVSAANCFVLRAWRRFRDFEEFHAIIIEATGRELLRTIPELPPKVFDALRPEVVEERAAALRNYLAELLVCSTHACRVHLDSFLELDRSHTFLDVLGYRVEPTHGAQHVMVMVSSMLPIAADFAACIPEDQFPSTRVGHHLLEGATGIATAHTRTAHEACLATGDGSDIANGIELIDDSAIPLEALVGPALSCKLDQGVMVGSDIIDPDILDVDVLELDEVVYLPSLPCRYGLPRTRSSESTSRFHQLVPMEVILEDATAESAAVAETSARRPPPPLHLEKEQATESMSPLVVGFRDCPSGSEASNTERSGVMESLTTFGAVKVTPSTYVPPVPTLTLCPRCSSGPLEG